MTDGWAEFTRDLAKVADLARDKGAASEEAIEVAGLVLESEGDGWWSVHDTDRDDNSLLDVVHATEYRSARALLWQLYRLTHRESTEADTDGHRHGREVA